MLYMWTYALARTCLRTQACIHTHVRRHVYIHTYACMYTYIHTHIRRHVYIHMWTYIFVECLHTCGAPLATLNLSPPSCKMVASVSFVTGSNGLNAEILNPLIMVVFISVPTRCGIMLTAPDLHAVRHIVSQWTTAITEAYNTHTHTHTHTHSLSLSLSLVLSLPHSLPILHTYNTQSHIHTKLNGIISARLRRQKSVK